jgi:hypothetical protein
VEINDTPSRGSLNALLEDERASVEMEVALINGATELSERETFAGMGIQEVGFCVALRERLERTGGSITPRINGVVLEVLALEHYDERLTAFADHQMRVVEATTALLPALDGDDLRVLLRDVEDAHLQSAAWCRRRAAEFAATRILVFRGQPDFASSMPQVGEVSNPLSAANGSRANVGDTPEE